MQKITAFIPVALLCAATAAAQTAPAAPPQGQKFTFAQMMVRGHDNIQRNLVEAAEKMPEEHYGFKPTPEIRAFSQVVMHAVVSRFRACSFLSAKPNPQADVKEDQPRPKAEIVALLKEGGAYCSEAIKGLSDESMLQLIPVGPNEVARGLMIAGENSHANEIYGTLAVYLRLKGLVPPSTERSQPKK
jgi:hypothetical protein